jgi:lipopolysaccharide export system permease protein
MTRLSAYLVRQFAGNATAIFLAALALVWLTQTLRLFDLISAKGQDMLTLAGQSALSTPPLIVIFFYACWGIGLVRALRGLQASQELHAIHSSRRLPALMRAVLIFATLGAGFILALTNFVEPAARKQLSDWSASIAADLVGRTLVPHRFTQVAPDVVIVIGGRLSNGDIADFFADDRRDPQTRRTYIAKSATVAKDEKGYALQLRDGSLQYQPTSSRFSEISFGTYEIGLDRLTDPIENRNGLAEQDSVSIVLNSIQSGVWNADAMRLLGERMAEGLRVIAVCLLVFALAGFPHARRARFEFPLELGVLTIAFAERGISTYAPGPAFLTPFSGSAIIMLVAIGILVNRQFGHLLIARRARPA